MDIGAESGREIVISNANGDSVTHGSESRDYRVVMKGGWLDLQNSGFHVTKHGNRSYDNIEAEGPIFSV